MISRDEVIAMAREAGMSTACWESEMSFLLISQLAALAYTKGAADKQEACAEIAGFAYKVYQSTLDAHQRCSPTPFNPRAFGFDMRVVDYSKNIGDAILEGGKNKI